MHLVMTVIGADGQIVSDVYGYLLFLLPAADLALLCWIGKMIQKELAIKSGKRTDFSPADRTKIRIIIGLSFLLPSFLRNRTFITDGASAGSEGLVLHLSEIRHRDHSAWLRCAVCSQKK